MTRYLISPKTAGVGRRKKNFDKMPAGFDAGTFDRMDRLLEVAGAESRKDYLRLAVEEKMQRDEQTLRRISRKPKPDDQNS